VVFESLTVSLLLAAEYAVFFCGLSAMNWLRIQQIRRNVRRDFLCTGFIGLPAAVGEPAWSAGKGPGDDVRGGIVDWVNKQKARVALDRLKDHEARR
jgi:hypothetical protein